MSPPSTRERILDAAEDLFAAEGVTGTSLRAITRLAGVNLAAVHYHFGSKQALCDAVVERRAGPVNRQRLRELERIESGPGEARIEDILSAFLVPGLRGLREAHERAGTLARLIARIEAQPPERVEEMLRRHFGAVCERFLCSLQRALPHLPAQQVEERFRFAIGISTRLFAGGLDLDTIPHHPPHRGSDEQRVRHAIAFIVAGLEAPALTPDLEHESDEPEGARPTEPDTPSEVALP